MRKYGSTGDQEDFGVRDEGLDNNMFLDRESGRPVRLPDISHLSHSSEMPEGIQGQPPQNFQLDPYALHSKQAYPATNHPANAELAIGKAQYYSQLLQKNPQIQQYRDSN